MQLMVSSLMEEGELAFGISHSGSNCNVINCLRNARENGVDTVALVSQGKTPLSKIADGGAVFLGGGNHIPVRVGEHADSTACNDRHSGRYRGI